MSGSPSRSRTSCHNFLTSSGFCTSAATAITSPSADSSFTASPIVLSALSVIATLAAAQAPAGLAGVVLVAASTPSPEPMEEARRTEMLGWFANGPASEAQAQKFVSANTARALPQQLAEQAIADVRRSAPPAWRGWLEQGAREDWNVRAGVIDTPALIVAGAEDGDLGEDAQRRLNAPHYAHPRVEVVADAAHLIPYEQPQALAALIAEHVEHTTLKGER